MEPLSQPTRADELLAHSVWVRRLALSLVGDAAAADDVVQQTWKAALERPPSTDRPLQPWLRRVVTNFARQRARTAGRRRERELAAAQEESLPGADELVERLDSQRALTEELGKLPENLRTTVLLRYFEDLEPSEIARRQGLPAGTVRWRLKRGLDELRERLDRRFGDRRSWALLFVPLARPVVPSAPVPQAPADLASAASAASTTAGGTGAALTGVWIMGTVLKTAGALAAVAVMYLGLAWTGALPPRLSPWPTETPVQVSFRPLAEIVSPDASAPGEVSAPARQRQAAAQVAQAAEPEPSSAPPAPSDVTLLASIFDSAGAPLAGGHLRLTRPWSASSEPSGADGGLRMTLEHEGLQNGLSVRLERRGFASEVIALRVETGSEVQLGNFRLEPGGAVSGRVLDASGRGLEGIVISSGSTSADPEQLESQRFEFHSGEAATTRSAADGSFLIEGVHEGFVRLWASGEPWLASYSAPVEVRAGQESMGVLLTLDTLLDDYLVRGVVLDPAGEPVADAHLDFHKASSNRSMTGSREADREGRFRFVVPPDMLLGLVARDPGGRLGSTSVKDLAGGVSDLVLRLPELRQATLLVRGAADAPLEHFEFRALAADDEAELFEIPAAEHPGGRAEFGLPSVPFLLEVSAPGHARERVGPLVPAAIPDLVEVALAPLPGLRGQVLAAGVPVEGARVRLFARSAADRHIEHNGFEVHVDPSWRDEDRSDDEGRFLLTPRLAGEFFVEAWRDGFAIGELGPLAIDPARASAELVLELGSGGAIEGRVLTPPGPDAVGRIVGISRGDTHARTQRTKENGSFRFEGLTPGPWQVRLVDTEIYAAESMTSSTSTRGRREMQFDCEVEEGRTTRFDIDLAGRDAVRLSGLLQFDGAVPGAWQASLTTERLFGGSNVAECELGLDGDFELIAPAPGSYRLLLMGSVGDNGMQALTVPLELSRGTTPWNLDIATATLLVENVPPPAGSELERVLLWDGPGGVLCMTAIAPDADGRCLLERVPQGQVRIVDLTDQSREITDPSDWAALATCEVRFGETNKVVLP